MDKKRFACRDYKVNYNIQCEEISDNGNWITYGQIVDLLNELHEENIKIKNILFNKKEELENDYNRGAKAGMPTGGVIGELDTIEDILEEMEWKND